MICSRDSETEITSGDLTTFNLPMRAHGYVSSALAEKACQVIWHFDVIVWHVDNPRHQLFRPLLRAHVIRDTYLCKNQVRVAHNHCNGHFLETQSLWYFSITNNKRFSARTGLVHSYCLCCTQDGTRFWSLVGENTFFGEKVCFYCMVKTNFSWHNTIWRGTKIFGGHAPNAPCGYEPGCTAPSVTSAVWLAVSPPSCTILRSDAYTTEVRGQRTHKLLKCAPLFIFDLGFLRLNDRSVGDGANEPRL